MKEDKEQKNICKILALIFGVISIISIAFIALCLTKSNDDKKEIDTLKEENEKLKSEINNLSNTNSNVDINNGDTNNKVESNYIDYTDDPNVKIYALNYNYIIFSYDDELYISVSGDGININTILYLAGYSEFKDNVTSTTTGNNTIYVYKTNIKADNVYKVILKHNTKYKHPTGEAYILYKDNGLTYFVVNMGMMDLNNNKILTEYKEIVDVKTKCIDDFDCQSVNYTIYTKDGNSVELDKIN